MPEAFIAEVRRRKERGTRLVHSQVADTSLGSWARGFGTTHRRQRELGPTKGSGKARAGVRRPEQRDAAPREVNRDGREGQVSLLWGGEGPSHTFPTPSIAVGTTSRRVSE